MSENVHVIDHPLVQHKLGLLRDVETPTQEFRQLIREVALLMGYEILRDLPTEDIEVETPMETTTIKALSGKKTCIIPILRAGNGFLDGLLELMPAARIGHIGLYRDPETLIPVEYYLKLPESMDNRPVIIVDPMLATGSSAVAAIGRVRDQGATNIKFLCLVSSPEGIEAVHESYPDVQIYTASVDRQLDDSGYILPGIGDAGDRMFGTK